MQEDTARAESPPDSIIAAIDSIRTFQLPALCQLELGRLCQQWDSANVNSARFIHSIDRLKSVQRETRAFLVLARKAMFRYYQLSVHLEA
jgi:hypothetical protein